MSGSLLSVSSLAGERTTGIRLRLAELVLEHARPVQVTLSSRPGRPINVGYDRVEHAPGLVRGVADVVLEEGPVIRVVDEWRATDRTVRCARRAAVATGAQGGFATALCLRRDRAAGWDAVAPFAPGAVYGDAEPVTDLAIGGAPQRRGGARTVLIREDRLAAPLFALRYPDGASAALLHADPHASTTADDGGEVEGGESLIDTRFGFASLGAVERRGRLELTIAMPGSEGEVTYTSGGLPLRQVRRWRRRFHPCEAGVAQSYDVAILLGHSTSMHGFFREVWRWAWEELEPCVQDVPLQSAADLACSVLASRVATHGNLTGVPLEVDAVTGDPAGSQQALMGFVGANTDAGELLLRVGANHRDATGDRYRRLGTEILDCFAGLRLDPPEGEGFDLAQGSVTTYRAIDGRPAVYARSLAEGCAAALSACRLDGVSQARRRRWLAWARAGGDWFLAAQAADGSFPRAWEAGTGAVLDDSRTTTYAPVPLLCGLAAVLRDDRYLAAAERAGEYVWASGGNDACFAGATLDNPNVVDKEAAVLALEAFLALADATGGRLWIDRAKVAADVAETWVYIWNVPMPADADPAGLHWKPGVPNVGIQLIATGVSMCDGFLAANAAAFARLAELTQDDHYLLVARLVTHGSKAMFAFPGRTYDLHGPGWQQEHWSLAIPRGKGLNRNWLPWVPVAHVRGLLRLRELEPTLVRDVIGPP